MNLGSKEAQVMTRCWELPLLAEPHELSSLRWLTRFQLEKWRLSDLVEPSQLCVTELVSNVIAHVGPGTPTTLVVTTDGRCLRIEVHDPDTRALPTLVEAGADSEGGRGMALVAATTNRWGVELHPDRKVTWCELTTGRSISPSKRPCPRVSRAQGLLDVYGGRVERRQGSVDHVGTGRLWLTCAEETAIDIITDLLHWLQTHGRDADDVLDRAQTHFEAQVGRGGAPSAG
ncbi:ATP-binding protein [Streptomyces sp. NPDC014006]|uniref:ATP-binding protein n=1 Tax=Streptomyces sp. NPDC014006 TaxID=3364870 RepID=UPI0036FCF3E2